MAGRTEDAVRYADAGQSVIGGDRERGAVRSRGLAERCVPVSSASPNGAVEWCRAQLARGRDTHALTRASLVFDLVIAGSGDEARAAADGLDRHRRGHPQPVCALVGADCPRASLSATPTQTARSRLCVVAW